MALLINKFPYKEMKRETTTEGRKYVTPDGSKLPSVIVTSTGLISEGILADLSRLVYMNHCWRSCVGLPPLGRSPDLFFVQLGEPYCTGQ